MLDWPPQTSFSLSLPHSAPHPTRPKPPQVLNLCTSQPGVEWAVFQINVELLQEFFRGLKKLHGHEMECLLLEVVDDVAHQAILHSIHLDWLKCAPYWPRSEEPAQSWGDWGGYLERPQELEVSPIATFFFGLCSWLPCYSDAYLESSFSPPHFGLGIVVSFSTDFFSFWSDKNIFFHNKDLVCSILWHLTDTNICIYRILHT